MLTIILPPLYVSKAYQLLVHKKYIESIYCVSSFSQTFIEMAVLSTNKVCVCMEGWGELIKSLEIESG